MAEFLNANQGIVAAVGIIISIIITIIGFSITNRNITKITQKQKLKDSSKGIQGGRDAVDKSINFKD